MTSKRSFFLAYVLAQMGRPYIWGAKGDFLPKTFLRAFDCSGLVTWALHEAGGPDWRATHNTDKLWAECKPLPEELGNPGDYPIGEPRPGTLVLYGKPNDPEHVMVHVGAGVVVGASGGGHTTLTLADAEEAGARVRVSPSLDYRPDRIGFRELPFNP